MCVNESAVRLVCYELILNKSCINSYVSSFISLKDYDSSMQQQQRFQSFQQQWNNEAYFSFFSNLRKQKIVSLPPGKCVVIRAMRRSRRSEKTVHFVKTNAETFPSFDKQITASRYACNDNILQYFILCIYAMQTRTHKHNCVCIL